MNDTPREKLQYIISQYGRQVCDDPKRCEGLLRDMAGEYKREISVLMGALREGVPTEWLRTTQGLPRSILVASLARRLQDNLGLSEEASIWAVESWGVALGRLAPGDVSQQTRAQHLTHLTGLPMPPTYTPAAPLSLAHATPVMPLLAVPSPTMPTVRRRSTGRIVAAGMTCIISILVLGMLVLPENGPLRRLFQSSTVIALPTPTLITASPSGFGGGNQTDPAEEPPTVTLRPVMLTPTEAPTLEPIVEPTLVPTNEPTPAPTIPPVDLPLGGDNTLRLEDASFEGAYTRTDGLYHGRTARWIYGAGTSYSSMSVSFPYNAWPNSSGSLTLVGLDSEDEVKTPILVVLNDIEVYRGSNPLPNDNTVGPSGPGRWGAYEWRLQPGILRQGSNKLTIFNLDPSDKLSDPPFFMLDYAYVTMTDIQRNVEIVEDTGFEGGFRRQDGIYHGVTASWVYGQGTQYHTMSRSFILDRQPGASQALTIRGLDSEDGVKTPILIVLNGMQVFEGITPLPNDDTVGPSGLGNWGMYTWPLKQGMLKQGQNELSITNLDPSNTISDPPFFMLDYAAISWID